jgi:hypothetical protein
MSNGIAGVYGSYSMPCIPKDANAVMSTIILLFLHDSICGSGHHLSMVMNAVKVTEEGQVWVPAMCQLINLVYYIDHSLCPVFRKRPLLYCPELFCCCTFIFCGSAQHLSLVMDGVKVTSEGQVWVLAVRQMVYWVYIDHTQWFVFRKRPLMQCPQLFCCCIFIFDTSDIICH